MQKYTRLIQCIIDSRLEKPARSALFTATQRSMNKDTIVILDSLNYIKGFRYQLYCAAKEAGVRVCTVSPSTVLTLDLASLQAWTVDVRGSYVRQMQRVEFNTGIEPILCTRNVG